MSNLLNVVDQVKAGAKRLEWIAQLAAELERIGSIEQAENEARQRLESHQRDLKQVKTQIEECETARRRVVEDTEQRGREIVTAATEKAQDIAAAAAAVQQQTEAALTTRLAAAREEAQAIEAACIGARATLATLQQSISAEEQRLATLRQTIKEKVDQILK